MLLKNSPFIRFAGSIQLAVPLLTSIALVLIGATFYEAQVGSAIVQQQIYKSGWFGLLMFALALNLGVSAMSRFPWRGARKVGFALTHLGLIVLIAGSAAVIHLGVEGMLPLRTDLGANRQLRLQGEVLEVLLPDGSSHAVDVAIGSNGKVRQQQIAGLTAIDYRDRTIAATQFVEGVGDNPALHVRLTSQRMGQAVDEWLAASPLSAREVSLGPATLELVQANDEAELEREMTPPDPANPWGVLVLERSGNRREVNVRESLGQTIRLGRDYSVRLVGFWPDFRLNDRNEPETASERLNNPALQVQVKSARGEERWFVFGRDNLAPVRTVVSGQPQDVNVEYVPPVKADANVFRAIAGPQGDWYYTVNASSGFQSGSLAVNNPIQLGWADFQIEVADTLRHAEVRREVLEADSTASDAVPALLVEGERGDRHWMQWGVPEAFETEAGSLYAVYSPKSLELPFAVNLKEFVVDRNEGTESVAMWTSQIRLDDLESGSQEQRKVWMNHPTWYRGWKIAQASWNPGDLRQSTLQVKREPAWVTALTWTGSLLVVAGIGVMFYGPSVSKRFRSTTAGRTNSEQSTIPETSERPSEAIA